MILFQLFQLTARNISYLPNNPPIVWSKLFSTIEYAKDHAEADYKKDGGEEKIKWTKDRSFGCHSQDLYCVRYEVRLVRIIK
jgi:hypothetical protein